MDDIERLEVVAFFAEHQLAEKPLKAEVLDVFPDITGADITQAWADYQESRSSKSDGVDKAVDNADEADEAVEPVDEADQPGVSVKFLMDWNCRKEGDEIECFDADQAAVLAQSNVLEVVG